MKSTVLPSVIFSKSETFILTSAGPTIQNGLQHQQIDLGKKYESRKSRPHVQQPPPDRSIPSQGREAYQSGRGEVKTLREQHRDVDSTDGPVQGKREGAAFNGYLEQVCSRPPFCFPANG